MGKVELHVVHDEDHGTEFLFDKPPSRDSSMPRILSCRQK